MAAIYTVFTSPNHAPIPNHLPTLIVTPHGQPENILYSYLHTNFNAENYLLTPSPQGDLCVAKLFPPVRKNGPGGKYAASDPGHSTSAASRAVRCEASRNLKWTIANTGVMSPIYKLSLPSPDSPDLPLFQVSKPNPNAAFWSMFYFAYAGHLIPPKRIEFGKIQKNPPGPGGGGTRISITGKTPEEKAVWQTLGEGNEDCVEWVVLCAALNLLDDEILKAAEKAGPPPLAIPQQMPPAGRAPPQALPPPTRQRPQAPSREGSAMNVQSANSRMGPPIVNHQPQQQYPPLQNGNPPRGPPPQNHSGSGRPNGGQRPYPNGPPQQPHPPPPQPQPHPQYQQQIQQRGQGNHPVPMQPGQYPPQSRYPRSGSAPPPNAGGQPATRRI